MKKDITKYFICTILCALLVLSGCKPAETSYTAVITTPPSSSQPGSSSVPASPVSSEPETAEPAAAPLIEGIGLDNYPSINGSTANHPLIARLYAELCSRNKKV